MATKKPVPKEHPTSRLASPDASGLPASVHQVLSEETERFGAPLNTTMVWVHHPVLLAAYRAWRTAMNEVTLIPANLKYLVYVRVASLNGCPF
jgi:alkylhydroperoxidase family enzyme